MTTPANILQEDLIEVFPIVDTAYKTFLQDVFASEVIGDTLVDIFPQTDMGKTLITYVSAISNVNQQTPEQKALRDLAKEAEKSAKRGNPISEAEAKILDDWADEYNVPQHHKAYRGSGKHFKGGNYSDHTHIYNIHVPYR